MVWSVARADNDIFSQGVGGLARGVENCSPLTLLTRPLRGTSLTSSNRRLSDILENYFF